MSKSDVGRVTRVTLDCLGSLTRAQQIEVVRRVAGYVLGTDMPHLVDVLLADAVEREEKDAAGRARMHALDAR